MSDKLFEGVENTESSRTIHTPSGFARKNLNFVQEIGTLKSLKAHSCIRENLESYLIFFIQEGQGTVSTGGKVYDVQKGDCIFLDCRKHYEHKSSETDPWKITWVHFNGKEADCLYPLFLEGNKNSPVFQLEEGTEELENRIGMLNQKQESKRTMEEIEASHMLSDLMLLCLKAVVKDSSLALDQANGELDSSDFDNLRESVNEHMEESGLLGTLAVQYGVKPEKLNEIFEQKYGIALDAYISNRKFNKAKELLRFTIKPIAQIAVEAGLGSEEEMRTIFAVQEDMKPEDYRKKWAQWIKS